MVVAPSGARRLLATLGFGARASCSSRRPDSDAARRRRMVIEPLAPVRAPGAERIPRPPCRPTRELRLHWLMKRTRTPADASTGRPEGQEAIRSHAMLGRSSAATSHGAERRACWRSFGELTAPEAPAGAAAVAQAPPSSAEGGWRHRKSPQASGEAWRRFWPRKRFGGYAARPATAMASRPASRGLRRPPINRFVVGHRRPRPRLGCAHSPRKSAKFVNATPAGFLNSAAAAASRPPAAELRHHRRQTSHARPASRRIARSHIGHVAPISIIKLGRGCRRPRGFSPPTQLFTGRGRHANSTGHRRARSSRSSASRGFRPHSQLQKAGRQSSRQLRGLHVEVDVFASSASVTTLSGDKMKYRLALRSSRRPWQDH